VICGFGALYCVVVVVVVVVVVWIGCALLCFIDLIRFSTLHCSISVAVHEPFIKLETVSLATTRRRVRRTTSLLFETRLDRPGFKFQERPYHPRHLPVPDGEVMMEDDNANPLAYDTCVGLSTVRVTMTTDVVEHVARFVHELMDQLKSEVRVWLLWSLRAPHPQCSPRCCSVCVAQNDVVAAMFTSSKRRSASMDDSASMVRCVVLCSVPPLFVYARASVCGCCYCQASHVAPASSDVSCTRHTQRDVVLFGRDKQRCVVASG